jgi:putative hydrolase of the HAD superfamily
MILIFDYFETLLNTKSMDFNRGLYVFWKKYYQEKCPFEDMKKYGEDLFHELLLKHKDGEEFPFVKVELPLFAKKFGGDKLTMSAEEEADFLMRCNDFELDPDLERFLKKCSQMNIPMYVLSNSGFRAVALMEVLNRFGIGKYFRNLWSSADFGKIKPDRDFFELAIKTALIENPDEVRENIVFIGDIYETDVFGAHHAGIRSAWLNKKSERDENGWATYDLASAKGLFELIDTGDKWEEKI